MKRIVRCVVDHLSRNSKRWLAGGGIALLGGLLFVAAIVAIYGRESHITFALSDTAEPAVLRRVLSVHRELKRIRQWKPQSASDAHIEALAKVIELPENAGLEVWEDLLAAKGADGGGELNGTVQLLLVSCERLPPLKEIRSLPLPLRVEELKKLRHEAVARRVEGNVERMMKDEADELFSQWDLPQRPAEPGWIRRFACWARGVESDEREVWQREFDRFVAEEIEPTLALYDEILLPEPWSVEGDGATNLQFVADLKTVRWNRAATSFDVAVHLALAANDRPAPGKGEPDPPRYVYDTGLRLSGVRVKGADVQAVVGSEKVSGRSETENSGDATSRVLDVASANPYIVTTQFERFVRAYGLPPGFTIHQVEPRSERTFYHADFAIRHADCPGWEMQQSLALSGPGSPTEIRAWFDEGRTLYQRAVEGMLAALSKVRVLRGFPVEVRTGSTAGIVEATFHPQKLSGGLTFLASLDEAGKLAWRNLPAREQRRALVDEICQQHPMLASLRPWLTIDSAKPAEGLIEGTMILDLPQLRSKPTDGRRVRWAIDAKGHTSLLDPVDRLKTAEQQELALLPAAPPEELAKLDIESVKQDLRAYLRQTYAALSDALEIEAELVPQGILIRLGLKMNNWPELELGPVAVAELSKVHEAVDFLLGGDQFRETLLRQWTATCEHPDWGEVSVKMQSWDPRQAELQLTLAPNIPHFGELLSWTHSMAFREGDWDETEETAIYQMLDEAVSRLEREVNRFLDQAGGLEVQLRVDRRRFGTNRWLSMRPWSAAFRGTVKPTALPFGVEAEGIVLDSQGLHWPTEMAMQYRTTFGTGYCAISDPEIRLIQDEATTAQLVGGDFSVLKNVDLRIGAKLTPPILSLGKGGRAGQASSQLAEVGNEVFDRAEIERAYGMGEGFLGQTGRVRWDNPWLHVAYLHVTAGGRVSPPKLAGEADLEVLDRWPAGHARLDWDMQAQRLVGKARVLEGLGDYGFPSLSGDLLLDAQRGLWLEGETRLVGIRLRGDFAYEGNPAVVRGDLDSEIDISPLGSWLPRIKLAQFHGKAKTSFDEYDFRAEMPLLVVPARLVAHIDKHGFTWKIIFVDEFGEHVVVYDTPYVGDSESDTDLARFREMIDRILPTESEPVSTDDRTKNAPSSEGSAARAWRKPSAAEVALTRELRRRDESRSMSPLVPSDAAHDEEGWATEVESVDGSIPEDIDPHAGSVTFRRRKNSLEVEIGGVVVQTIPQKVEDRWRLMWFSRRGGLGVRITGYDAQAREYLLLKQVGDIVEQRVVSEEFAEIEGILPEPGAAPSQIDVKVKKWRMGWRAIRMYLEEWVRGNNPRAVKKAGQGYLIQTDNDSRIYWMWGYDLQTLSLDEQWIPRDQWDEQLFERIMAGRSPGADYLVIAAEESGPRVATLSSTNSRHRVMHYDLRSAESLAGSRVSIHCDTEIGDSFAQFALDSVIRSVFWKSQISPRRFQIGAEAAVMTTDSEILILPRRATAAGWKRISRQAFEAWKADTDRFLPLSWRTSEQRKRLDDEAICRVLTSAEWRKPLSDDGEDVWGANPLGLVLGLAESANREADKP